MGCIATLAALPEREGNECSRLDEINATYMELSRI